MKVIDSFSGKYSFLSNFFVGQRFKYEDLYYDSAEAAFQASKCLDERNREKFTRMNPSRAKSIGRIVRLRPDWECIKDDVMKKVLLCKFSSKSMASRLINTGDAILIEGNTWEDTYWGVCDGVGENRLGKLLMEVREECKKRYAIEPDRVNAVKKTGVWINDKYK